MGNRRLSRKRLYQVEKAGQAIDLEAAVGIKDAIISASQHRQGQELITEIAIDLGTSKAVILGHGTSGRAIGTSGAISFLTQLTVAKFGIITEIRAVVLEAPTTGDDTVALEHVANATKTAGQDPGGSQICTGLSAVGEDTSQLFDTTATLGQNGTAHHLYLITNNSGAASQFGSGKLVIYIHGFVAPDDL